MFDSTEPLAVKTADLAGLIGRDHAELVSAECGSWRARWAVRLHTSGHYQPLIKRACAWGGEGTPGIGVLRRGRSVGNRDHGGSSVDR